MKSSSRVLDDGFLEAVADPIAIGGDELHVIAGGITQPGTRAHRQLRADCLLEICVAPCVGIELGAVAR